MKRVRRNAADLYPSLDGGGQVSQTSLTLRARQLQLTCDLVEMASPVTPSPRTWILKFKNDQSTILLHVEPQQKMSTVRDDLLKAIKQTHPDGFFNGERIPDVSDTLVFARPKDPTDVTQGWEAVGKGSLEDDLLNQDYKGKGKAAAGRAKSKAGSEETPQGLGFVNSGLVAFKFATKSVEEVDELDSDAIIGDGDWNVVIPALDDLDEEEEEV